MSFLDQPLEVIIQQLSNLSVNDLLNLCDTNTQLKNVCESKDIWYSLIERHAPLLDRTQIQNPREYYLQNTLQDVPIYRHVIEGNQVKSDLIYKGDVFLPGVAQNYAVSPFTIVYSTPIITKDRIQLDTIAVQDETNFAVLPDKSLANITQIDIISPNSSDDTHAAILDMSYAQQISELPRWQKLTATFPNGETRMIGRTELALAKKLLRQLGTETLVIHKVNNTPLYQEWLQKQARLEQLETESNINTIGHRSTQENLESRRDKIYNEIVANFTQLTFDRALRIAGDGEFLGFSSYENFLRFQREYLDNLNESQLQTVELLYQLLPISKIFNEETGTVGSIENVVVFNSLGNPIFTDPR
jgi:hypothetical protein